MSSRNFRHFDPGINSVPQASTNVAVAGDIDFSTDTSKFNGHNGTIASPFVLEGTTATLTNKTLTAPVIATIINSGTLTLPTSTDTLVGRNTTDTLTNKTIAAGSNTITGLTNSNLSGSAGITGANIASNTVANSNLSQMATHTIKGNASGGTANAADLTGTQTTALLDNFVGDSGSGGTKGLVPAPAAGDAAANKLLGAGGTWVTATGQGVTTIGTIDSQTASTDGAVIASSTSLVMQSASGTKPGLVNNTTQTLSGAKTFSTSIKTGTITDNTAGLTISSTAGQDLKLQGTSSGSSGRLILEGQNGTDYRQVSTPSGTPSNYDTFYFKSDDKAYYKTNGGTEYQFQRALSPTIQALVSTGSQTGWVFFVSSANATVGATYTNNSNTYTVQGTIASGTVLFMSGTGATSGSTLTKSTGSGDATITFSSKLATATYTTPANTLYLKVRAVGGGAGGAGSGSSGQGSGSAGTTTYFGANQLSANAGGVGTGGNPAPGGGGGSASLGNITSGYALAGGGGGAGSAGGTAGINYIGGAGGNSIFGGGGFSTATAVTGGAGATNSGAGGGGAGITGANGLAGGGGGAGGFCEAIINSPAATYPYIVGSGGAGGTAGVSGAAGGAGGSGFLYIEEYLQ